MSRSIRAAVLGSQLVLAAVFGYAALSKWSEPGVFAASIANYHVLPESLAGVAAIALPVLELVVVVGLFIPSHRSGAAALASALLVLFAIAMAQAKLRGIDLECGCFGTESRVSWPKVGLDLGLAAIAAWLAVTKPTAPFATPVAAEGSPR